MHRVFTVWPPGGWGTAMTTESLTYFEPGDRLGTSPEAARSLTRRFAAAPQAGNDGKVRIIVDLAEIQYAPHRADADRACDARSGKELSRSECGSRPRRFRA